MWRAALAFVVTACGRASFDSVVSPDVPAEHIEIVQYRRCNYVSEPGSFPCALSLPSTSGNAVLVHLYYNYPGLQVLDSVTDSGANTYAYLDIGAASCPGGSLPNGVCCTVSGGSGTCQGWAVATRIAAAGSPITVTVTLSQLTGNDTMGAEVFEVSGLADLPLDQGASQGLPAGTTIATPTITTSNDAELIIASVVFLTSSSTMTAAPGWMLDQDPGFFAAAEFQYGGAGSYGGSSMGTITAMIHPGTTAIFALR